MYKHFTYDDRLRLEALYKVKTPRREMARVLGKSERAIYYELKRGSYVCFDSRAVKDRKRYSADVAQANADFAKTAKGPQLKLGNDYDFVRHVERKILKEKWSPDAVIMDLRVNGSCFKTDICTRTLYSYISMGLFPNLTTSDLLMKGKIRRRKYSFVVPVRKRNLLYESIDKRPPWVNDREEPGHWEMDTVKGKHGTRPCLLVLTERVTRMERVMPLKSASYAEVQRSLDLLERTTPNFREVFKSITCDNGSEFGPDIIETSCLGDGPRTKAYFCHPYSSFERGSNENHNRLIRRFIPKGSDASAYLGDTSYIESYMNNLPRRLHGGYTPKQLFDAFLSAVSCGGSPA